MKKIIFSILAITVIAFMGCSKNNKETTNLKDGSVLIEIPAGSFSMGSNENDDEKPVHTVYLDKYYIGKYEVTVGQFKKFCNATGTTMPEQPNWNTGDNYPVVLVSWDDAKAYCAWAGLRLPTEAEWEKAARGTDGRKYPWGNEWNSSKCYSGEKGDNENNTSPVGSLPTGVSPYGAYDMAGNVWEWCNDWYDEKYYSSSPSNNPTGPSTGEFPVLRGGSFSDAQVEIRIYTRYLGCTFDKLENVGFRVAKTKDATTQEDIPPAQKVSKTKAAAIQEDIPPAQKVTKAKFTKIQEGMSYAQVVKIIGAEGEVMSSSKVEGIPGVMASITTKMYMWQNTDGSNMNAMFQNNKLMSKAQFGLE
ncbi:SUMF1/EgtB/PvdO family nonheme iron enzyme [candidate division TA06 bacterium]|nr:SUMF1/EgtB/PvdO family nonheme iron enzyme [candidate division TA06 bacterium]